MDVIVSFQVVGHFSDCAVTGCRVRASCSILLAPHQSPFSLFIAHFLSVLPQQSHNATIDSLLRVTDSSWTRVSLPMVELLPSFQEVFVIFRCFRRVTSHLQTDLLQASSSHRVITVSSSSNFITHACAPVPSCNCARMPGCVRRSNVQEPLLHNWSAFMHNKLSPIYHRSSFFLGFSQKYFFDFSQLYTTAV